MKIAWLAAWLALLPLAALAGPEDTEDGLRAARTHAVEGRRQEAIEAYTRLLERSPGNTDALLGRGRVYAWEKRWEEAEADLLAATKKSPRYADAWAALGDMYQWSSRPEPARDAYARWKDLKPQDPDARMALGRAHRAAGDTVAARQEFEAARSLGADRDEVEVQLRRLERRAIPEAAAPAGYDWSLQSNLQLTQFSHGRSDWTESSASLRRYFDTWSLAVEGLGARRFDQSDDAWALDAYVDLWSRAYANLRFQTNPDGSLYPETAWRVELFQGVGHGWELSAGIDQLIFSSTTADIYSLGIGKYLGNWYLRWKHLFPRTDSSSGDSDQLLARWYYAGNSDDYCELRAGAGQSTRDLDAGGAETSNSTSAGAACTYFWHPRWGFKLGAGYGEASDESFVSRSVSGTIYFRWSD